MKKIHFVEIVYNTPPPPEWEDLTISVYQSMESFRKTKGLILKHLCRPSTWKSQNTTQTTSILNSTILSINEKIIFPM